jgi:hypothetical protein
VPTLSTSPLESRLLTEFHNLHHQRGFPDPRTITVIGRDNTGAGRYVTLQCLDPCEMEDGYLDLGGRFVEMPGVAAGLMAVVRVSGGRPAELEIAVFGEAHWDGEERQWTIK